MNPIQIGKGAAKVVWKTAENPGIASLTPRQFLLLTWFVFEPELREEVKKAKKIQEAVSRVNRSTDHLAVDLTPSSTLIKGQYTVQTPMAKGDMEQEITRKDLTFTQRLNLCLQCLEGFSALHAAGWIHRDIKPENMLVYKKDDPITVKVSDWGKAKQVAASEETTAYDGNGRFAPPEFRSSFKSEIYSLGLVLLRVLEESILSQSTNKDMLIEPLKKRTFVFDNANRGFIKYIFSNSEGYYFGPKWLRRLVAWWNNDKIHQSTEGKKKNQELTYAYIDELSKRISEDKLCSKQVAEKVTTLIKEMTHFNPQNRPTSQHAFETFQAIVENHKKDTTPVIKEASLVESIWARLTSTLQTARNALTLFPQGDTEDLAS